MTLTLNRWPWYSNLTWIILNICLHTNNEISRSRLSKVRALQTDRQTYRQMSPNASPRRIRGWQISLRTQLYRQIYHEFFSLSICRVYTVTPASESLVTHCVAIGYTLLDCNALSWEIAADNAMRPEFPPQKMTRTRRVSNWAISKTHAPRTVTDRETCVK